MVRFRTTGEIMGTLQQPFELRLLSDHGNSSSSIWSMRTVHGPFGAWEQFMVHLEHGKGHDLFGTWERS